jgi:hypothetical protein
MSDHRATNQSDEHSRRLLSPQEFSQLTGLSLATVHRYLKSGRLYYLQPGGPRSRILIPADALGPPFVLPSPSTARASSPSQSETLREVPHLPGYAPRWIRKATQP